MNSIENFLDDMVRIYVYSRYHRCYTCDKWVDEGEKTVGHAWSRRNKNIRWNLNAVRLQCVECNYCNIFFHTKNGDYKNFRQFLKNELGDAKYSELEKLAYSNCDDKWKIYEEALEALIEAFLSIHLNKEAELCKKKLIKLRQ